MEKKIKSIIEDMDDGDKIALWNNACRECGCSDDEIYNMEDFDEIMGSCHSPLDIVRKAYYGKHFAPNDAYFRFDGYANLVSLCYAEDKNSPFNINDLVDLIMRNENSFGCDEIADVLNGEDDDDGEILEDESRTIKFY